MTVNVLVLALRVVFFRVIFFVTRYMYDARGRDFALSASLFQNLTECFDGSELTGKGNDSIAQTKNCVVEEIKEFELRTRCGKFIYTELTIPLVALK